MRWLTEISFKTTKLWICECKKKNYLVRYTGFFDFCMTTCFFCANTLLLWNSLSVQYSNADSFPGMVTQSFCVVLIILDSIRNTSFGSCYSLASLWWIAAVTVLVNVWKLCHVGCASFVITTAADVLSVFMSVRQHQAEQFHLQSDHKIHFYTRPVESIHWSQNHYVGT